jgi:hypothetical protein
MQTGGGNHGRNICWQKNEIRQAGALPQEFRTCRQVLKEFLVVRGRETFSTPSTRQGQPAYKQRFRFNHNPAPVEAHQTHENKGDHQRVMGLGPFAIWCERGYWHFPVSSCVSWAATAFYRFETLGTACPQAAFGPCFEKRPGFGKRNWGCGS